MSVQWSKIGSDFVTGISIILVIAIIIVIVRVSILVIVVIIALVVVTVIGIVIPSAQLECSSHLLHCAAPVTSSHHFHAWRR